MSKTMGWVLGILAVLGLAGLVIFAIMWNKEKKANGEKTTVLPNGTSVSVPPKVDVANTSAIVAEEVAARKARKSAASYSA